MLNHCKSGGSNILWEAVVANYLPATQVLPVPFRFTGSDVSAAALWGVTGVVGAVYLVQVSIAVFTEMAALESIFNMQHMKD